MKLFKKNKEHSALNQPHDVPQAPTGMNDAPATSAQALMGGLTWYRVQFRRATKLVMVLGLALCLTLIVIIVLIVSRPTPQYFAATPDLRLAPLTPLDKPILSEHGLLNWVSETITGALSLNFLDWRKQLNALRSNFDDTAFKSLLASLESSGTIDMVRNKRLSVSAVITSAPVIIASGIVGGKATWRVEFPLLVSYESSQGIETTQQLIATVLISRASTVTTPRGVAIHQVVFKRNS